MSDTSRIDIITIDLAKPLQREKYGTLLATGDEYANRFGAHIVRNGEEVDVTGYTVSGSFIRPDVATVQIDGAAEGNTVYVDLPSSCYTCEGTFTLALKIIGDSMVHTVRMIDGYIRRTDTGAFVVSEETVYNVEQIKGFAEEVAATTEKANELMSEMDEAVDEANQAAEAANQATENANQAAENANGVYDKLPIIGENENWWNWDAEAGEFVDSGLPSRGEDGNDGTSITVSSVSESTEDGGSNVVTFSDGKTVTIKNGSAGNDGDDGTSITVSSVSESAVDGGSNVVTFSDGKTITIKNGSKGSTGDDGTSVTVENVSESADDGGSNVVTFSDGKTITIKNGNKGKDGTGVTILGSYGTVNELKAAHSTGNPGDAYMVDGELYVWSATENTWISAGTIKGPQGNPGADGTSVTVSSVSESAADGGNNVVTFSDGKTVTIKNGSKGGTGADGTSVTVSSVSESTEDGGSNVVTFSDGKTITIKNGSKGGTGDRGEIGPAGEDGKDAVTSAVSLTVASTAWTGDAAPFTATVACDGVTADNHLIVGVGGDVTADQQSALAAAMIICTAQAAGSITLTAYGTAPAVDLPVNVMIVG